MTGDPWTAVASLARSIDDGEHGLEFVPQLLKIVIVEDCWRDFVTPLKKVVHYERFEDFVTTPPTKGLGSSVELIEKLVADDPEALRMLRALTVGKRGGNNNPYGCKGKEDLINSDNITIDSEGDAPGRGTSRDYTLDRLHRESPELYQRVLQKELSAHAAAVLAGFRPKTFTVREDPIAIAEAVKKRLSADQVRELALALLD